MRFRERNHLSKAHSIPNVVEKDAIAREQINVSASFPLRIYIYTPENGSKRCRIVTIRVPPLTKIYRSNEMANWARVFLRERETARARARAWTTLWRPRATKVATFYLDLRPMSDDVADLGTLLVYGYVRRSSIAHLHTGTTGRPVDNL